LEFISTWIPRLIYVIMSLLDASNLRNRVHEIENEHELMWTALDDIKRMYPDHQSSTIAKRTLEKVKQSYGRQ
jgi:hypothetical protein